MGKREFDGLRAADQFEADTLRWLGSVLTEGRRHADDETFAGSELLGQVDLVTRRTLDEVDIWDGSTDFNHVDGCLMEGSNGSVC